MGVLEAWSDEGVKLGQRRSGLRFFIEIVGTAFAVHNAGGRQSGGIIATRLNDVELFLLAHAAPREVWDTTKRVPPTYISTIRISPVGRSPVVSSLAVTAAPSRTSSVSP